MLIFCLQDEPSPVDELLQEEEELEESTKTSSSHGDAQDVPDSDDDEQAIAEKYGSLFQVQVLACLRYAQQMLTFTF